MTERVPDFIYIGPPKAASSWLFSVFKAHSKIFVPDAKDLYFFDRYYHLGSAWYKSHFKPATNDQICGEVSHDYLYSEEAPDRILKMHPGVKIICILRDPVERAVSHFRYSLRNGTVSNDIVTACEQNPLILECSRYSKYLDVWIRKFPAPQIGIFFYDDLTADAEGFARRLLEYIGAEYEENLPISVRVNVASQPRSMFLSRLSQWAAKSLRALGLANLLGRIKYSSVRSLIYKPASTHDGVSESDVLWLRRELQGEYVELEGVLGRPISWGTYSA